MYSFCLPNPKTMKRHRSIELRSFYSLPTHCPSFAYNKAAVFTGITMRYGRLMGRRLFLFPVLTVFRREALGSTIISCDFV